jgi:hypothetical protein
LLSKNIASLGVPLAIFQFVLLQSMGHANVGYGAQQHWVVKGKPAQHTLVFSDYVGCTLVMGKADELGDQKTGLNVRQEVPH